MGSNSRKHRKPIKHQDDPGEPNNTGAAVQDIVLSCFKALALLILAATSSPISQLNLSPIYGSIPSSIHHQRAKMFAFYLAWALKAKYSKSKLGFVIKFLPVLAFSVPTIQYYLFRYSSQLGVVYGPLVTEIMTYCPLVCISALGSAYLFDTLNLSRYGELVMSLLPSVISYATFTTLGRVSTGYIGRSIGSSFIFSRLGLQVVISTMYAALLPSKFLLFAVLPLLHIFSLNVHTTLPYTTAALNSTLIEHNFTLLARQESLTGYISVLEYLDGFRVMRCDHSLLGGEWIQKNKSPTFRLKEPIYSVFVMLEAVRLLESRTQLAAPNNQKQALVVGLGIGTTPSALIAHGVNTTIIEIDPVVHDFATRYFNLPLNHTAVIEDATIFVDEMEAEGSHRNIYDYIIHDVFTGGAEPVELFTQEFLTGLSNSLSTDGVIAINYAGDLLLPSASIIVHTIRSVFPSCRIYREDVAPTAFPPTIDFTNMVVFCRKSNEAFNFRDPVEADYLGSQARRRHLLPKYEILWSSFDEKLNSLKKDKLILKRGNTGTLEAFHRDSALGHWRIMRTVLPAAVWENW